MNIYTGLHLRQQNYSPGSDMRSLQQGFYSTSKLSLCWNYKLKLKADKSKGSITSGVVQNEDKKHQHESKMLLLPRENLQISLKVFYLIFVS